MGENVDFDRVCGVFDIENGLKLIKVVNWEMLILWGFYDVGAMLIVSKLSGCVDGSAMAI